jgi:hypothetical protein
LWMLTKGILLYMQRAKPGLQGRCHVFISGEEPLHNLSIISIAGCDTAVDNCATLLILLCNGLNTKCMDMPRHNGL